jgi:Rad3-related DNA helicase
LLYCALHLPDPRDPGYRAGVQQELIELITAAGGRTLALFTSWAAMSEAAEAVRSQIPHKVLTQRDLPKPALIKEFLADESTCLFATAGFFQGVDIPAAHCRWSPLIACRFPDLMTRCCLRVAICSARPPLPASIFRGPP